jgi:hypothetical protein
MHPNAHTCGVPKRLLESIEEREEQGIIPVKPDTPRPTNKKVYAKRDELYSIVGRVSIRNVVVDFVLQYHHI